MRKGSQKQLVLDAIKYVVMLVIAVFTLFPVIFCLTNSFRNNEEILKYVNPLSWKTLIPVEFTMQPYIDVFNESSFSGSVRTTLWICALTILGGTVICSLAGFALAKFKFKGKSLAFSIVLFTIMIPFDAVAIPLYSLIRSLKMTNTLFALLLPAFANGMVIFLFKQFFEEIPDSLIESARIDGAHVAGILIRIILPMSTAILIGAGLLFFMNQWDSFMWPLLVARSKQLKMVQIALSDFKTQYFTIWNQLYAASLITAFVPMVLLVPFSRYFVQSIASSGLKE